VTALPTASDRQRDASDPRNSAWVNANAGSGKTRVLVDRVIRLLLDGAEPSKIMCLTFTKAAAAEMSNRLFERLSAWVVLPQPELRTQLAELGVDDGDSATLRRARRLFTRALETPGGLKIQTIHAFCERVLQAFPVEAGVVPRFAVLDERGQRDLLLAARGEVLDEALKQQAGDLGFAVADVVRRVQPDGFDDLMQQLLSRRAELYGLLATVDGVDAVMTVLRAHLGIDPAETAQQVKAGLVLDLPRYRDFADALATGSTSDLKSHDHLAPVLLRPTPSLLDLQGFYLTQKGEARARMATNAVLARLPWLASFAAGEQQRLIAALGRLADLERLAATRALLILAGAVMRRFEAAKRRQGAYDFDDLIIRTAELLATRSDAQWVLFKLDGGIEHLLVDEAQDTSPAQWRIVTALTQEFFAGAGRHGEKRRTIFAVGDRKQSIYSFQGADPDIFAEVQKAFAQRLDEAGQRLRDVDFTVSFRSAPEILQAVDKVFAPDAVARRGLDGAAARDWVHESNRRAIRGVVEIWPLVEPLDKEDGDVWTAPVDREPAQSPRRRLAAQLAETIRNWIGRRIIAATGRTVQPDDILVLVQKRNVFFDALIRELRQRNVPVAGADRLKLAENIAVQDLMALAAFCLMTEDDHALACVLKSPILARPLGEEELMAIAIGRGTQTLWQTLSGSADPACRAAAAELGRLVAIAPSSRPYDFLAGLLVDSRMRFLSRLGSEANDALDALLGQAMRFEEDHPATLAGFVNWFAAGETEIKRNMEQASGEVRIMTVHGAKGLEAPIVILADTATAPDTRQQPPLLLVEAAGRDVKLPLWPLAGLPDSVAITALKRRASELQAEEYRRLLYVAMTRARDELYICGYTGRQAVKSDCWHELAVQGLGPIMREVEDGIRRLGPDPVYVPAQASPAAAAVDVPSWVTRPAPAEENASPRTVSSLLEAVAAEAGPGRDAAARRGIVIHRILQLLPDTPPDSRAALAQRLMARAGHAPQAAASVLAMLERPEMQDIFAPGGLSEIPLAVELPGLGKVMGRIDRLVVAPERILAVDFKTGQRVPAGPSDLDPAHVQQMAAYREALRRIHPGTAVVLALLYTEAPKLLILDDDLLDRAAHQIAVMRP